MPIKATERSSLVDRVIEQLQTLIESGEWPVGTKIPAEPVLVDLLGVGRNTVRESVRALVHSGMLEALQGDGTYVRAADDLGAALLRRLRRAGHLEALEVRAGLERDAARLAALRRTPEDVVALREALRRRGESWRAERADAFIDDDVAFHRAVVAAAHNGMLKDLYNHLTEGLRAAVAAVAHAPLPPGQRFQLDSHADLVDAIEAADADAAVACVARYIDETISSVRQLQDADPLPGSPHPHERS
ncbi:FadR/GntR family transcriptional regulator [Streptomyces tsukubensis]|uniref:GntR family transcriptional regulator n=1 Tax=Streptomyces tsukubensis TaxID=83656 RepID=A0A1V3ZZA4_9ACTN|nr:FCD domain-containing protein [Streptomyces tsukubensis]OON71415.1 GntR family transcriptional regulator [Streptomyces tsukubensis]QFR92512.1 FCD domain-containing protein [Streptomyces tsukubensis]